MKIVFLMYNLGCGGMERTVSYLSAYFAQHGADTEILCMSGEKFYELSENVKFTTLNIDSASKNGFDRFKHSIQRYVRIGRYLKNEKPDVVVCMLTQMIRFVKYRKKRDGFCLITSERNNPLVVSENIMKENIKGFTVSDGIVFQTERAKECYPENLAEKGTVIPNAVGNELAYDAVPTDLRRKVITAVGRLNEQKDYPTLIKAFGLFLRSHKGFTLEIFGEGKKSTERSLKELVKEQGLEESVRFMGISADAVKSVASSSCYVLSSVYEGMPNALMEALAVGTPCVSTDCPFGPRELICNGENGLLVPVGDENAMADAISRLIDDGELNRIVSQNARKILETNSIENISKQYLDYITSIAEKKKNKN